MNPAKFSCENGKYTKSIIDNSVIICNEVMKATNSSWTKTVPTKNTSTNFYILTALY